MKLMGKKTTLLALLMMLQAPVTTFGQTVFSDNFDAQPDWKSNQLTSGGVTWGTTNVKVCTTNCPPVGWTSYRAAKSLWTPNARDTYIIDALGARGGSGKGLTYNVESSGTWGTWAGGAIDKYLGPEGYQELYVRFWLKETPEFCWGSELLNENAMGKFLRISALRRNPMTTPQLFVPQVYPSPDTSPSMIADGYRRFQPNYGIPAQLSVSERYAPDYQSGPGMTYPAQIPNDSTTGGKGYCGDDKWHSYEFYVKMNSALDLPDGAYRVWLDGKLVAQKTTIPWVKSGVDANGTVMTVDTGWNWVMLADNINSTAYAKSDMKEMARYVDDVVISTHYSGPPPAPVNLVATTDASSVRLTWANGTNGASYLVDGYHIYYGTDPGSLTNKLTVGNVNQAEITDLGSATYYFAVSGYNKTASDTNENEGERSEVLSASVAGTPLPPADVSAPVAAIVSPAAASALTGSVTIEASASDNIRVNKVEFYLNGSLFGMVGSAPYTLPWNTANSPNGSYTIVAKAYDEAGNLGEVSATVQVNNTVSVPAPSADATAPTVKITSPGYGSTVSGTTAVLTTASDNVAVTKVELYVNNVLKQTASAAPFTLNWDTSAFANGAYSLKAKAYDGAGNVGLSSPVTVYVGNNIQGTAPTVKIASPAYGSTVGGAAAIETISSDTTKKVELYVNGNLKATSTAAPFTLTWNTLAHANGAYSVRAKAYDAIGNVGESSPVTLYIANSSDSTAPAVTIVAPASGSSVSGTTAVTASASDNVAVSKVELYVNGTLQGTSSAAPYAFTWNTASLANGDYTLSVKAYDAAGNIGQAARVATVLNDTIKPVVSITSLLSGSNLTVSASASDNLAVQKVEFYLDGILKGTSTSAPYGFTFNTTSLANGGHILTARAYDAVGNIGDSNSVSINVVNDLYSPSISSFAMPSVKNSSTVEVTALSAMDDVGVTGYLITESATVPSPNAGAWSATRPASFTFSGTGYRTAYAWAKDAAGRVSAASTANVVIDTLLPVISSMTLANGANSVTLNATATDNVAVSKMQVYVDDVLQVETTENSITYIWVPTASRSQHVMLKVYDSAGNMRSRSMKFWKM